ncbi:hypothetical protein BDM02DRAFT_3108588 [Thelephora ganbajun]|uniref:Uncharacterized protein n=1 Tax=Thelephora ganbajun TaxID=370292 RepID=A0ACB6ZUY0_THEGA|nr:hypothetical protein BDM02DRAFT_3108588 [Thelephora ganbajun]
MLYHVTLLPIHLAAVRCRTRCYSTADNFASTRAKSGSLSNVNVETRPGLEMVAQGDGYKDSAYTTLSDNPFAHMSDNDHPRQRLNNFLQSMGMINDFRWIITRQGPPHNPVWYTICLGWSFF